MIRERGEDLPRESCFGFVVMVVISCWRFLEVRGKVSGEKPNLRVFLFLLPSRRHRFWRHRPDRNWIIA